MAERSSFYSRTLEALIERGLLRRDLRVLVVAGGPADRDVFHRLGFADVTISNLGEPLDVAPYAWERQDAEALTYEDSSFDWGVVSAGLHHCRSPHAALLELYRVARRGLLALEARDSALMRAAIRLGAADEYELTAVADNAFSSGGVRDTAVPNYVYRWTEREVEKTIRSAAPHARDEFVWFHELELPLSVLEVGGGRRRLAKALRALQPAARIAARVAPGQANLFAFAVLKSDELQPWLRPGEAGPVPDEVEIRRRLG